jgi:hypothetical protein
MNDPTHILRLSSRELAAVHDLAKAGAAAARAEAFEAAWVALVAGVRRLVFRARETATAQGPYAVRTPRHADFR